MYEFKLPDLGEGIHEAEILKWYVAEGERIAEDAPLVDVETDKAAVTIPSPVGGRVVRLAGKVGDVLTVGQVVAVIDSGAGEAVTSSVATATAPAGPPAEGAPMAMAAPLPAVTSVPGGEAVPSATRYSNQPASPSERSVQRISGRRRSDRTGRSGATGEPDRRLGRLWYLCPEW